MSSIVVDAATRDLLRAGGQVTVKDDKGAILGVVIPTIAGQPTPPPGYVIDGEWPSDEEIDRRMREGKRYTIEQVLERLRSLDNAG